MKESLTISILFVLLSLFLIVVPVPLQAGEMIQEIEPSELVEVPRKMTEKQMNDLFGEDPYLGQTSYLQSPDGFSQIESSK